MKVVKYPSNQDKKILIKRPEIARDELDVIVSKVLGNVKINKDQALVEYAQKFDSVKLTNILVSETEISEATTLISEELKAAINLAKNNIEKFHAAQKGANEIIETSPGVQCWRKSLPIEKVGLYIPGGTAPLFSTILMLGVPATLAGCKEIVLCSPPNKKGKIHPAILHTANLDWCN